MDIDNYQNKLQKNVLASCLGPVILQFLRKPRTIDEIETYLKDKYYSSQVKSNEKANPKTKHHISRTFKNILVELKKNDNISPPLISFEKDRYLITSDGEEALENYKIFFNDVFTSTNLSLRNDKYWNEEKNPIKEIYTESEDSLKLISRKLILVNLDRNSSVSSNLPDDEMKSITESVEDLMVSDLVGLIRKNKTDPILNYIDLVTEKHTSLCNEEIEQKEHEGLKSKAEFSRMNKIRKFTCFILFFVVWAYCLIPTVLLNMSTGKLINSILYHYKSYLFLSIFIFVILRLIKKMLNNTDVLYIRSRFDFSISFKRFSYFLLGVTPIAFLIIYYLIYNEYDILDFFDGARITLKYYVDKDKLKGVLYVLNLLTTVPIMFVGVMAYCIPILPGIILMDASECLKKYLWEKYKNKNS